MSEYPAFVVGLLSLIGGSIGYARKGSIPSLLGGLSVGLLYIISGLALRNGSRPTGRVGALGSSMLLLGSSAPRAFKGPVPAILTVLGTLLTLYYARAQYISRSKGKGRA